MEQVTLQAIKLKQLSRKQNGVTGENSSSDGFMQIIDNMLANLIDGESTEVTDVLTGKSAEDTEQGNDASILAMLSELLQSGNGNNLSQNILEILQNVEEIDNVEIPNIVSKLQENNFFEAMGMDEDAADTLYTLGNNTYDYLDAQTDAIRDYITSKLEVMDAGASTNVTQTVMETGVLQNREPTGVHNADSQKLSYETNEIPIISVSYEKTSETVVQPNLGVTVPNMVSQKIVKADLSAFGQENSDSNETENGDFSAQLSEIATANANATANINTPKFELPKVQNLSNPLFDEFNISEQITDGVKANLNLEKTEFTVKLNPESLGELTLKLVEENGKMVLDITAASESTAKLLNSDLTALRDSLGNMNLEIREVTVQAPETVDESIAQFNMTSQQFSDQQRAFKNQQQQGDKPYYAATHGVYDTEEITADYTGRVRTAVDGLDTYV